jgi:hypothetical protein
MAMFPKYSASARRYSEGDSILAPLTLSAGAYSIGFILKARVKAFTYGAGGIAVRVGRRRTPVEGWTVTVDGRTAPEAIPVARILFK